MLHCERCPACPKTLTVTKHQLPTERSLLSGEVKVRSSDALVFGAYKALAHLLIGPPEL